MSNVVARAIAVTLSLGMFVFAAAALATPMDVLRIVHEKGRTVELESRRFRYEFVHSIFQAVTSEEFAVEGRMLRLVAVRSTDRRVFEQQRWTGEPRDAGGGTLVMEPTPTLVQQLRIQVTKGGGQRIVAERQVVELEPAVGDGLVAILPAVSNRAQWVVGSFLRR